MGLFGRKKDIYDSKKNKNIIDSFKHAYEGIVYSLTKERNMAIHVTIAVLVVIFGALFSISYTEWLICFILIGLVLLLELINTSIEAVVDLITLDNSQLAKRAKDTAAGAVLVGALLASFIGIIIFAPKIFEFIMNLMI